MCVKNNNEIKKISPKFWSFIVYVGSKYTDICQSHCADKGPASLVLDLALNDEHQSGKQQVSNTLSLT